jgi:hypothetical protein
MTHSLIHADHATHCRILTLAAAMTVVILFAMFGIVITDAAVVRAPMLALEIGKLGIGASLHAAVTR